MVFTRDLRVRDNPALIAACEADCVVPLFIVDEPLLGHPAVGVNRIRFLLDALADLDRSLRLIGGALVVRRGDWLNELMTVVEACGADVVHLSDDGSARAKRRLRELRSRAESSKVEIVTHPGVTVVAAGEVLTAAGTPFQMFTPYYRRWIALRWRDLAPSPRAIALPSGIDVGSIPSLEDVTQRRPSPRIAAGGEVAGLDALRTWTAGQLARYGASHDAIADDATSRISPYLHFGCLSPLEVATRLRDRPGGDEFVRQLCWRDFFHQLLSSRPDLAYADMHDRGIPSGTADESFAAWCNGQTGYPLVDAGMRQLRSEGCMHNRVRMVVASFLTKDLDVPWQVGARYFMEHLVDGDLANNQLNWQWVAGTGTDANPHRIFNPIRQSERFDPDGAYIRRYVGELQDIDSKSIHDPSPAQRARCGYSAKLVDHAAAIAHYRLRRFGP